ncbi:hypothetical protein IWX46DRAFT_592894 [Phyllosticta citricarpa]|uniref:Secreted protein n=1 Tax=Phyllosticta citricarpa TaxID=55181 RepID=A0ABR1MM51_9PEZI
MTGWLLVCMILEPSTALMKHSGVTNRRSSTKPRLQNAASMHHRIMGNQAGRNTTSTRCHSETKKGHQLVNQAHYPTRSHLKIQQRRRLYFCSQRWHPVTVLPYPRLQAVVNSYPTHLAP